MTGKKSLFGDLLDKEGFYQASSIIQSLSTKVPQRSTAFSTSPSLNWLSVNGFVPGKKNNPIRRFTSATSVMRFVRRFPGRFSFEHVTDATCGGVIESNVSVSSKGILTIKYTCNNCGNKKHRNLPSAQQLEMFLDKEVENAGDFGFRFLNR